MKLQRVLIIYKKSTYQIQAVEHKEPRFIKLLDAEHEAVTRVKVAHAEHYDLLEALKSSLADRQIKFTTLARIEHSQMVTDVDLVISVGGDGTFLDASHFVSSIPLLGINSSKSSSFGHFCLANRSNFNFVLDQIISDAIKPISILRLELQLNGSILPELVLNEVLVSHSNPAGTSRYFIENNGIKEEQRSGGIWIGPAAGSTGSIRAAGGAILPIADRQYQYIVREPGFRPYEHWHLLRGLIPESKQLKIVSQMRTGSLYIDGQHINYSFALGDELIVQASKNDLLAYVNSNTNEIFSGR